jgi:hypothetical protein
LSGAASAQSWAERGSTPDLSKLVAIDATGETLWPFGREDVAGDGLATFAAAEQGIDVRSAYAEARSGRLWLRLYVSAQDAVADDLTLHVFIDADENPATGGSASASEVDDRLGADPSAGGYERVLTLQQGQGLLDLWRWNEQAGVFEADDVAALDTLDALDEEGSDLDPLRVNGDDHGYLQTAPRLQPLGIGGLCQANLLFRSVDATGQGDRDVGEAGPCVARDADRNSISDIADPDGSCTTDADCAGVGSCEQGTCRLPEGDTVGQNGDAGIDASLTVQGGAFTCRLARGAHGGGSTGAGLAGWLLAALWTWRRPARGARRAV